MFNRCNFVKSKPGIVVCPACGNWMRSENPATCYAECKGRQLGDWLSRRLASGVRVPFYGRVSITTASYRRWKVRCGLSDACNCAERKEKLNRFGRWLATLWKLSATIRQRLAGLGRTRR